MKKIEIDIHTKSFELFVYLETMLRDYYLLSDIHYGEFASEKPMTGTLKMGSWTIEVDSENVYKVVCDLLAIQSDLVSLMTEQATKSAHRVSLIDTRLLNF